MGSCPATNGQVGQLARRHPPHPLFRLGCWPDSQCAGCQNGPSRAPLPLSRLGSGPAANDWAADPAQLGSPFPADENRWIRKTLIGRLSLYFAGIKIGQPLGTLTLQPFSLFSSTVWPPAPLTAPPRLFLRRPCRPWRCRQLRQPARRPGTSARPWHGSGAALRPLASPWKRATSRLSLYAPPWGLRAAARPRTDDLKLIRGP